MGRADINGTNKAPVSSNYTVTLQNLHSAALNVLYHLQALLTFMLHLLQENHPQNT